MNLGELVEAIENQISTLNYFEEVLLLHQKGLVESDLTKIDKAISGEEKTLSLLKKGEKRIVDLVESISKELEPKSNIKSVSALISLFEKRGFYPLDKLIELRDSLKEITGRVVSINLHNKFLVMQSRSLMRQLITTIAETKKSPVLDRKI